jgi:hypothetical protein
MNENNGIKVVEKLKECKHRSVYVLHMIRPKNATDLARIVRSFHEV